MPSRGETPAPLMGTNQFGYTRKCYHSVTEEVRKRQEPWQPHLHSAKLPAPPAFRPLHPYLSKLGSQCGPQALVLQRMASSQQVPTREHNSRPTQRTKRNNGSSTPAGLNFIGSCSASTARETYSGAWLLERDLCGRMG